MNKLILTTVLSAATLLTANAVDFETAADAVKHMGPGINLANSFECHSRFVDLMMIEKCKRVPTNYDRHGGWSSGNMPYLTTFAKGDGKNNIPTIEDYETAWEQPQTTRALIHMWKEAGFGAVRLPVTWYPHMDQTEYLASIGDNGSAPSSYSSFMNFYGIQGNGGTWDRAAWLAATAGAGKNKIDPDWLARVQEVVDWIIEEGMYCIINVHHDTGASQHEAPDGTKNTGGNSRWINANYAWWPDPNSSASAPRREDPAHTIVIKVVNPGTGQNAWDTQLTFADTYNANTQYTVTFDVYSLRSGTIQLGIQDYSDGNSVYNGMEQVTTTAGEWMSVTRSVTLSDHTCPHFCMNLNVNSQANTYYFDNVKINGIAASTPTLNGGTLNTNCDFTTEDLTTPTPPTPTQGVQQYAKDKFIAIWEQIADYFGDYGDHLLFEGYNEVLDGGANEGNNDWGHGSSEGRNVTSDMAKTFVNTVRASASAHPNNGVRNLIIPTYYASDVSITVPTDNTTDNKGHLITEVHCYPNVGKEGSYIGYNNDNISPDGALTYINNHFANDKVGSMGIPMILGEWGSTDIFKYDVFRDGNQDGIDNRDELEEFSTKLYSSLKQNNRAGFIWRSLCDEGHRGYTDAGGNFVEPRWNTAYVGIKDAMMKGWYGEKGYGGVDYGVYPNLYTVHNGTQLDKDNGYLATNRAIMGSGGGTNAMATNLTITDGEIYRFGDSNVTSIFADKLTFTRVFKHDKWMPLYVPFVINAGNFSEVAEFAVFKTVTQTVTQNNGTDEITVTLNAEKVNSGTIAANTPCLIKLKAQGSVNPSTFRDTPYTFEMTMGWSSMYSSENGNVLTSNTQNGVTWTLGGTYEPLTGNQLSGMFAMTEGRFRACLTDDEDEVLRPNRIYLKVTSQTGAPMRLNVVVSSDDEELSSIADIFAAPHDDVYYDLMGRPVAHPTHGFYIRNGQKVFIK